MGLSREELNEALRAAAREHYEMTSDMGETIGFVASELSVWRITQMLNDGWRPPIVARPVERK